MRKLELAKQRDQEAANKPRHVGTLVIDQAAQLEALEGVQKAVESLYGLINDQEPLDITVLSDQLTTLHKALDFSNEFKALREAITESKVETVDVKQFNELIAAVEKNKPLPLKIDLSSLEKAIISVEQRIQEGLAKDQGAENYQPVRRVIKVGNALVFDDQRTSSGGGGGGGTSDLKGGYTIHTAKIDVASSGANTIVAAATGLKVKVLSAVLVAGGTVTITWQSDSTALSGAIPLVANSGYVLPASSPGQGGYLETAAGAALKIGLSDNIQVSGHLTYYLEG